MQQRYIVLAIIIALGAAVFFMTRGFNSKGSVLNYPSTGTDIVAYGDSLIVGYGATQGHDFVSLLSKKIGQPIVNLGTNGATTVQGVNRLGVMDNYKPKVVLLLLGGNDALQRVPPEKTFENLRAIISDLQGRGTIVVLLGIRGGVINARFDREFPKLAEEMHTAFVPDVLDGLFGDRKYMADEVHPNDLGNAVIAAKIYPVLAPLLK